METDPQSQLDSIPRDWRLWVLVGAALFSIIGVYLVDFVHKPYPAWPAQWAEYLEFADRRPFMRVPNFGDVFSNALFLLAGAWGTFFMWRCEVRPDGHVTQSWEKWGAMLMFIFVFLTGSGSAYFHLNPNNTTLFWDRLPMGVVFMIFFSLVIGERLNMTIGKRLLPVLVVIGVGSVVYWHWSELRGAGDLRPYGIVQFYPMLAIPILLLAYRPRYTHSWIYAAILGCYLVAKILEKKDGEVLALLGGAVSGHSLKHLVAGGATWFMLELFRKRRAVS